MRFSDKTPPPTAALRWRVSPRRRPVACSPSRPPASAPASDLKESALLDKASIAKGFPAVRRVPMCSVLPPAYLTADVGGGGKAAAWGLGKGSRKDTAQLPPREGLPAQCRR